MSSSTAPQSSGLSGVQHIIVVLSGKGGVGKSTVACQLALTLQARHGKRVGILDVDICGPSVPKICGAEDLPVTNSPDGKWLPVEAPLPASSATAAAPLHPLKVMSIAYLLPSANDAVVWRGPRKDAMIKQFIADVSWGALDYLIVDTPPGTSDEHMTLCEMIAAYHPAGAVVVTTPQDVSTDDVRKELSFCAKLKLRVLGIVENMSGFVCPHCSTCTDIFSKGGGRKLAEMYECPFLGEIPIDPNLAIAEDNGVAFVDALLTTSPAGSAADAAAPPSDSTAPGAAAAVLALVEAIRAQVRRVEELKATTA